MYRVGIDVGGTNTDAAALCGNEVIITSKQPTTADITSGIVAALRDVLAAVPPSEVGAVMIGTTHFVNAVVQRRHLARVAIFRLCGPSTHALPPMVDWPADLHDAVHGYTALLPGGLEYDGQAIEPLDESDLRSACREAASRGLRAVVVSGVFSPLDGSQERQAGAIIAEEISDASITFSHEIGRLGLLERESAAILNASLRELGTATVTGFRRALAALDLNCPLFLTQNDGSLMSAAFAERFPVLTFASGPTNSMRGAAFLSGLKDAIVVDIGGTTTDVGALTRGFPREASVEVEVGGVRTNFRMPEVLSIGLGGGSLVTKADKLSVGPLSVGYELSSRGLVFGGDVLTATDIAVAAGTAAIGEPSRIAALAPDMVAEAMATMQRQVEGAIDRAKVSRGDVPVILVGGGSILVPGDLAGASSIVRPPYYGAANAVGAAIAQVSGEVDRVISLEGTTREHALLAAKEEASRQAIAAGAARGSVQIVEVEDVPLAYLPGSALRVRVKAVGELAL